MILTTQNIIRLPKVYQTRPFLLPVILVVILALGIIGLFFLFKELQNSWGKVKGLENDLNVMAVKSEELARIDRAKIQSQKDITIKALPEALAVLPLMSNVRQISVQTGVQLTQMAVSLQGESKGPTVSNLRVDVVGALPDMQRFLESVEKSLPVVSVGDGRLSSSEDSVSISVTFQTFAKKIPTQLPAFTEQVNLLTKEEEELTQKLYQLYNQLPASTFSVPAPIEPRPNPFTF